MARFALCSAVYLGDLAPYIPVDRRLADAGNGVTRLMEHPFRNTAKLGSYWHHRTIEDGPDAALASREEGFAGAALVISHPTMWRRVRDLGVGDMARTPRKVVDAVTRLVGDAGAAERSRALGALVQQDDGAIALAEEAIELLGSS